MLFVTNRRLQQGLTPASLPRTISFDLKDATAGQYLYFGDRSDTTGVMDEVGNESFFNNLKISQAEQLLFYIHGFNVAPSAAFDGAYRMQAILDQKKEGAYIVIPVIWGCEISPVNIGERYYGDQMLADASGAAFARLLMFFLDWRDKSNTITNPCFSKINILAHSMGNRVLRQAFLDVEKYFGVKDYPRIFNNFFMVGADLANHTFEKGEDGEKLPHVCRNTCVYFANDDYALSASKVANSVNTGAKRAVGSRLGQTGTENLSECPKNVCELDCNSFNSYFDNPMGHTYFISKLGSNPLQISPAFEHMYQTMETGRPPLQDGNRVTILPIV
jgi:esterase/lipase superfamily enzyme